MLLLNLFTYMGMEVVVIFISLLCLYGGWCCFSRVKQMEKGACNVVSNVHSVVAKVSNVVDDTAKVVTDTNKVVADVKEKAEFMKDSFKYILMLGGCVAIARTIYVKLIADKKESDKRHIVLKCFDALGALIVLPLMYYEGRNSALKLFSQVKQLSSWLYELTHVASVFSKVFSSKGAEFTGKEVIEKVDVSVKELADRLDSDDELEVCSVAGCGAKSQLHSPLCITHYSDIRTNPDLQQEGAMADCRGCNVAFTAPVAEEVLTERMWKKLQSQIGSSSDLYYIRAKAVSLKWALVCLVFIFAVVLFLVYRNRKEAVSRRERKKANKKKKGGYVPSGSAANDNKHIMDNTDLKVGGGRKMNPYDEPVGTQIVEGEKCSCGYTLPNNVHVVKNFIDAGRKCAKCRALASGKKWMEPCRDPKCDRTCAKFHPKRKPVGEVALSESPQVDSKVIAALGKAYHVCGSHDNFLNFSVVKGRIFICKHICGKGALETPNSVACTTPIVLEYASEKVEVKLNDWVDSGDDLVSIDLNKVNFKTKPTNTSFTKPVVGNKVMLVAYNREDPFGFPKFSFGVIKREDPKDLFMCSYGSQAGNCTGLIIDCKTGKPVGFHQLGSAMGNSFRSVKQPAEKFSWSF